MDEETKETIGEDDGKSAISADLIRGHINTIILRTLYDRDKYGYEIIEEIEKKSHGQYTLKQPTLYSALKRLEAQGYITAYWKTDEVSLGGRRKYYTLTDSGREITEKNQAEWEYSRTVIDNLISDRSFDFTQPPPASSVDFKILKKSTSRVPRVKDDEDDEDEVFEEKQEVKPEKSEEVQDKEAIKKEIKEEVKEEIKEEIREVISVPVKPVEENPVLLSEQRRILHENYMRLISEPLPKKEIEVEEVPLTAGNEVEKIIYGNKPETERDYRNLINNLYNKTVQRPYPTDRQVYAEPIAEDNSKTDDINAKAEKDGLKVNSSEYVINAHRKSYNKGGALFKSSLLVFIILLLEFTLCTIFKNELGVNLAYPFTIFAIAVAQLGIFGVLYYTDLGKSSRKPSSTAYLSVCIIITVIAIFIIFLVSILLNVKFSSASDIMAKLIIPSIVALNIPVFAVCFYYLSK